MIEIWNPSVLDGIEKELKDIEDLHGKYKEINVLRNNMDKYGSMFNNHYIYIDLFISS